MAIPNIDLTHIEHLFDVGQVDRNAAQRAFSPSGRKAPPSAGPAPRAAAALAYLYESSGELRVPLTRRAGTLREHAGQISLPGGRPEIGESLWKTAIREAWEEISLPTTWPRKLGVLAPVYIPVTHTELHVFVATGPAPSTFGPPNDEVVETRAVPLRDLVNPLRRRVEVEARDRGTRTVPFMDLGPFEVWGATAMALGELAMRLERVLQRDASEE